jgi:hypothetical protein
MRILFSLLLVLFISTFAFGQQLTGDYVESRNADVYTGYCFANSEIGLAGDTAILGWRIRSGSWNGVPLEGLTVAAVVRARDTLGNPYGHPYPARAVLIVDDQATTAQRAALLSFAHAAGGELLANVVKIESAPMELVVPQHGFALLRAGYAATVQTRAVNEGDHYCGNEETYYPPLTQLAHAMPAVAVTDEYRGPDLGATWELHGKRSAFVGTFALGQPAPAVASESSREAVMSR